LFYAFFNIRLFLYLIFQRTALLVSNDLDTLPANYLASKFKPNCRLVYDTHEYFTEVPELQGRAFVKKTWENIENWIFPMLNTIYTVNESIAELYHAKYNKKIFVVRNVAPMWQPAERKTRKELGLPENKFIAILQGAGINIDRGAKEAVEAVRDLSHVLLIILGDGDAIPSLKAYVAENSMADTVRFIPKIPYAEMMQYTACADVGLSLDKATNLNYRFSLPNKVFDYIHAGIPLIVSNLPEVAGLIQRYDCGIVLNTSNVNELRQQLEDLRTDPEKVHQLRQNCVLASQTECWEKESEILHQIYPRIV
jgi:glycosyltransferase involved in cell wall biosynthesis